MFMSPVTFHDSIPYFRYTSFTPIHHASCCHFYYLFSAIVKVSFIYLLFPKHSREIFALDYMKYVIQFQVIHQHFLLKKDKVLAQCKTWLSELKELSSKRKPIKHHYEAIKSHVKELQNELKKLEEKNKKASTKDGVSQASDTATTETCPQPENSSPVPQEEPAIPLDSPASPTFPPQEV